MLRKGLLGITAILIVLSVGHAHAKSSVVGFKVPSTEPAPVSEKIVREMVNRLQEGGAEPEHRAEGDQRPGREQRPGEDVEVGVNRVVPEVLRHDTATTGLERKFSMQFCAAEALATGRVEIASFAEAAREAGYRSGGAAARGRPSPPRR